MPAGWRRRAGGSGTQCQTATCSAEPEEHATMLVTLGTLVAGLAVVAVAFEAPHGRVGPWCRRVLVIRAFRLRARVLSGSREIAAFRRAGSLRMQHSI